MKLELFADVTEQGSLTNSKQSELNRFVESFAGKRIKISVERKYNQRSNNQNRFFHGVVIPIIQQGLIEAGWNEAKSFEWTKDFIKMNCLVKEYVNENTGEVKKSIGKTSELSTSEFMNLISEIQQWASEYLNVYIPEPGESVEIDFK